MAKPLAIISYVQNHWDWKDIDVINLVPHLCVQLQPAEHHQLDPATNVALHGHGAPKGFHGLVVGLAQQRLPVHCHQLIVHSQATVLQAKNKDKFKKPHKLLSRGDTYGKARCRQSDIAPVTQ